MRGSQYNFFFDYEQDKSKKIAYNSLSSSLALIDEDKYNSFMDYCEKGKPIEDEALVNDLKKGLFLVDDSVDELNLIRFNMLRNRFSTSGFGLTIAPTSDCNFRCAYCYEKDVIAQDYMSEEIQDRIIELLKNQINTIASFSVTWYGGEPLMAMDVIERLSKEFITICEEKEKPYSAGIITNGFLLTRDVMERLSEFKVGFIQVTVDGMPETHNKRRPLVNGEGTFDTIMKNLKDCYDVLPRVSLRINVDKNNLDSGRYIYTYLKENNMLEKITPYFGKVSNDNDCYEQSDCLNTCDYAKIDLDYSLYVSENKDALVKYPSYKSNFCGADYYNSFVIGANGNLYKCWNDIGIEDRSVGNIIAERNTNNETYYQYLLFDPTTVPLCSKCKLLPVCMGGCPNRRLNKVTDNCSNFKYVLDECIAHVTKIITENREKENREKEKENCSDSVNAS